LKTPKKLVYAGAHDKDGRGVVLNTNSTPDVIPPKWGDMDENAVSDTMPISNNDKENK